jgi:hypothetical protein
MMLGVSALPVDENEEPQEQPAPNRSARVMAEGHGLTAEQMNILLKDQGFLEGDPGAYRVTSKGEPFAAERIESSSGGDPSRNPSWGMRTWSPELEDELDLSPERKREVREIASDQRRQRAEQRAAAAAAAAAPSAADDSDTDGSGLQIDPLKTAAVVTALFVAGVAIWKGAPHAKRLWREKAAPGITNAKDRVKNRIAPGTKTDDGDEGTSA